MKTYHLKQPQDQQLFTVDYESALNQEQLEAVLDGDGIVLILAGPGSGKTRTLVYRVAYLLERGAAPHEIMLATFTNKASREMMSRVEQLVGRSPRGMWGGTFHHLGHMVMRAYGSQLGFSSTFGVLDAEDSRSLIGTCLDAITGSSKDRYLPKPDVIQSILSFAVNTQASLGSVVESQFPQWLETLETLANVEQAYQARKRQANVLDYDDLLEQWRRLLVECPEIQQRMADRLKYILIDEFQDTNRLQFAIIQQLMTTHRNLMVVGDDAQGIYSFRGANIRNILDFPRMFPETKIFRLETNYRSHSQILDLANESILYNTQQFQKTLKSTKGLGALPVVAYVEDVVQQAEFVVQRLLELKNDENISLNEMSVLFRAKYQSAELELALMRHGVPYVVRGGVRFFEQAHIKDVLAYLRVVANPTDELSWKRILLLQPGIGKRVASQIWDAISSHGVDLDAVLNERSNGLAGHLSRGKDGWERLRRVLRGIRDPHVEHRPSNAVRQIVNGGYAQYLMTAFRDGAERLDDLEQLANFAAAYEAYEALLSDVSLREGFRGERLGGDEAESDEMLVLSSIHQAKGLEWSVVMVLGMADGQFPNARTFKDQDQLEEERRLFYVAITRAKTHAYCVVPMTRQSEGGAVLNRPSQFIRELSRDRYDVWRVSDKLTVEGEELWLVD